MASRSKRAEEDTENRRRQLRRWVESRFGGRQSAFIAAHGLNQSEISQLMNAKSFGSVKARKLEEQCGMPLHYLEQRDAAPSAPTKGLSPRALALAQEFDAAGPKEQAIAESVAIQILRGNPAAKPAPVKRKPAALPTPEPAPDR